MLQDISTSLGTIGRLENEVEVFLSGRLKKCKEFFVAGIDGSQAGGPGNHGLTRRFQAVASDGLPHFQLRREPRCSPDKT
jgi:hypothetical protein